MKNSVRGALIGCRAYALSIFCVYVLSCTVGIFMVHNGNQFALSQRDRIVASAIQNDKAAVKYRTGNRLSAAFYDFAGNIFFAAIPQTILGIGIVPPYITVACQGWVGGVVSVDGSHRTRFIDPQSTAYYFIVLLLQTAAFSLCIGAGVKCGLDTYKQNVEVGWKFWNLRIRKESILSVGYVYLASLPLFLAGSCFEFLSTWNK